MSEESKIPLTVGALSARILEVNEVCRRTIERSFEGDRSVSMGVGVLFASDLSEWGRALALHPEARLYARAEQEYLAALINVAQGQYSNAFKGLRLVLELTIQGSYLSANLVELQEWLRNCRDTNWAVLMEPDTGPISVRFADSFFPDLREHVGSFGTMARTLYRELSETIHGNVPKLVPLPPSLDFDEGTFLLWHQKASTARMICLFCLCLRYLLGMSEQTRRIVEPGLTEQLGHIEAIRILLGGPSTL